jgi:hypothetical protein
VGASSVEKLVSTGKDGSSYLHYRPIIQDASGEFVATCFRAQATSLLGSPPPPLICQPPPPSPPEPLTPHACRRCGRHRGRQKHELR